MRLRTALTATIVSSLTAAASALGLVTTAAPASAAAIPPVVVSPAPGGTAFAGSTGPLVIDFPTPGHYSVSVECGDVDYYWLNDSYAAYYSGRVSITIDPLRDDIAEKDLTGKTCHVTTFATDTGMFVKTESDFTLIAPPLSLGDIHVTEKTFYPLVKDDYLDETKFVLNTNRSTDATLRIFTAQGKRVYIEDDRFGQGAGRYEWPWKGTNTAGKPVKPGSYRAVITASADGIERSEVAWVRVKTKKAWRSGTLRKDGFEGHFTSRGKCEYGDSFYYDYSAVLDCRGGTFAAMTYTFKIPATTRHVRWSVSGRLALLDFDIGGKVAKSAHRVGKTKFQIRVQVTGWRAYEIRKAEITYKARVQI